MSQSKIRITEEEKDLILHAIYTDCDDIIRALAEMEKDPDADPAAIEYESKKLRKLNRIIQKIANTIE